MNHSCASAPRAEFTGDRGNQYNSTFPRYNIRCRWLHRFPDDSYSTVSTTCDDQLDLPFGRSAGPPLINKILRNPCQHHGPLRPAAAPGPPSDQGCITRRLTCLCRHDQTPNRPRRARPVACTLPVKLGWASRPHAVSTTPAPPLHCVRWLRGCSYARPLRAPAPLAPTPVFTCRAAGFNLLRLRHLLLLWWERILQRGSLDLDEAKRLLTTCLPPWPRRTHRRLRRRPPLRPRLLPRPSWHRSLPGPPHPAPHFALLPAALPHWPTIRRLPRPAPGRRPCALPPRPKKRSFC